MSLLRNLARSGLLQHQQLKNPSTNLPILFRSGGTDTRIGATTGTGTLTRTRTMSSTSTSTTPIEDTIREKITQSLSPTTLIIRNDSHLHSHHAPMKGVLSKETHFFVTITSPNFQTKPQPTRHRMVYGLLKDEMSREGGIHALQLRTRTPEEEEREMDRLRDQQRGQ